MPPIRLLATFLLMVFSSAVWAKDMLVWGVFDFPPFQIREGSDAGSGSFDGELQTLIAGMPEYEHRVVRMSFARLNEEFNAGTQLCTPGKFRSPTNLAMNMAFSMPALLHLDNRVVFLKSNASRFGNATTVDLDALFKRTDLTGAIVPGRSYGSHIDEAVKRFNGAPNLMMRSLANTKLFQMLLSGDLDYVILFPHETAFLAQQFGAKDRVQARQIVGVQPYIFTHVVCTKGDWGYGVIQRVNAVLKSERPRPNYRSYSERWYSQSDRHLVRRYYPEMLKQAQ